MKYASVLALLLLSLCCPAPAQTVTIQQLVTNSSPGNWLFACTPPGDARRLFAVSQGGQIRIFDFVSNQLLPTPFLNLMLSLSGPETGLLGMAFHPQFQQNGFVYIYYSSSTVRRIVRYKISPADPNIADTTSATTILSYTTGDTGLHQGGWIGFGPDGFLYIAWGNNSEPASSQAITNNLLGKLLRLDVNGPDGIPGTADDDAFPSDANRNYCIPPTNPFVGITGDDEIWAYGLRNPFRCSFDRATGDLWIGDVGDNTQEELDLAPAGQGAGRNYGYPCMEGTACGISPSCACNTPGLTPPIYTYLHSGHSQAVIGGYVYRGCAIPWLIGRYIFGDLDGHVWALAWNGSAVTDVSDLSSQFGPSQIRSFGEDANGELYLCSSNGVFRILPAPAYLDCNGNGIPDGCEIANGSAPDVNHNFIIDSCEHPWPCNPDYNQDGDAGTDNDIEDFFACLGGNCCPVCGSADFNGDGDIGTDADIESFFRVLAGGPC